MSTVHIYSLDALLCGRTLGAVYTNTAFSEEAQTETTLFQKAPHAGYV